MKELTIEEKAKAYDEALEQARKELKTCGSLNCDAARQIFRFFPELTENEDEKIRKFLIKCVQQHIGTNLLNGIKKDDVIVWLEKQKGCIYTADDIITAEDHAFLAGADWQKEQNKKLEKQGEQTPGDKPEPKFKVGDWVVYERSGNTYQIHNIDNHDSNYIVYACEPLLSNNDDIPCFYEEMIHLWTIQDAKDGDVLAWYDSKCIALFKEIYDNDSFKSYGFVGACTGVFENGAFHDIKDVHPATKEQRDILFQKMKEAGYEWDSENKELKEIEDEYIDLGLPSGTLWKSANEDWYYKFDEAVEKFGSQLPSKEQWEELKDCCTWEWGGDGYKVVGPNDKSIVLPAAGYRCGTCMYSVGTNGYYRSSKCVNNYNVYCMCFDDKFQSMRYDGRFYGESVRLVK